MKSFSSATAALKVYSACKLASNRQEQCYFLAYSYKKGYLSYYNVPPSVINQVDIISIIIAISSLFTAVLAPYAIYINFKNVFYEVTHPATVIFKNNIIPLIVIWLFVISIASEFFMYWTIGLILLIIWVYFSPFIKFKSTVGYRNKLQKYIEKGILEGFSVKNWVAVFKSKSLIKYFLLFILTFGLGNIVASLGMEMAKKERDYIKISYEDIDYIILDVIGENYIIAPFDQKTKSIAGKYSLIEIKSNIQELIVFENIKLKNSLYIDEN